MNDLLILAMMLAGPRYGYQLKREAGWITGQGDLHNNLVYPSLRRFLDKKWVTKKAVPGERGQTRQQYALTPEGRRYLFERIREFSDDDAAEPGAFHLRIGLFGALKGEEREAILARREQYLNQREGKLGALQDHMDLGKFGGEIVRYMREQFATEVEWIRRVGRMGRKDEV